MFDVSMIGMSTAFAAGAISFLSPCVLPLVPGYVSYVAGHDSAAAGAPSSGKLHTFMLSLCFVLGFSSVFVSLGAGANALGSLLRDFRVELNFISGFVVIVFGLFTTGLLSLSWLQRDLRWHGEPPGRGPLAAFLLGMAFAFGWTPCIGPVLGAILALTTSSAGSHGITLLVAYSLGLGLPFILAALFLSGFVSQLKTLRRSGRALQIGAGVVMVAMGSLMITGHMTTVAMFLLESFPVLGRIG